VFKTLMDFDPSVMPIRAKVEDGEILIPLADALAGISACGLLVTRLAQAKAARATDPTEKEAIILTALIEAQAIKDVLTHFKTAQTCAQVNL
jgi:hypothetical protein